eukprot:scaffold10622_cov108-Isochrysis_galbana.AAC.4
MACAASQNRSRRTRRCPKVHRGLYRGAPKYSAAAAFSVAAPGTHRRWVCTSPAAKQAASRGPEIAWATLAGISKDHASSGPEIARPPRPLLAAQQV